MGTIYSRSGIIEAAVNAAVSKVEDLNLEILARTINVQEKARQSGADIAVTHDVGEGKVVVYSYGHETPEDRAARGDNPSDPLRPTRTRIG